MDVLGGFLRDCCVEGDLFEATAADLYKTYGSWCENTGERAVSQRVFGEQLAERGLERRRGSRGRHMWVGIGLTTDAV